jgi:hypothetical protein
MLEQEVRIFKCVSCGKYNSIDKMVEVSVVDLLFKQAMCPACVKLAMEGGVDAETTKTGAITKEKDSKERKPYSDKERDSY